MELLLGVIALLFGGLLYVNNKRKTAEALNENEESLEQVREIDLKIGSNKDKIKSEEDLRKQKEQEMTNAKKDSDMANVIDFLNRLNKK